MKLPSNSHAVLSPSSAHRWLSCSASPALEMNEPDTASVYAQEGTLAHAICESKLKAYIDHGNAEDIYTKEHGRKWVEEPLYSQEMEECSDYYRDIVLAKYKEAKQRTPDAKLLVEVYLDLSEYITEGYGTSDAVIISDNAIEVIDYKHGKGVKVSSEKNPQMMIYALGAYDLFSFEYRIDRVNMTIVQPRLDNVSAYQLPAYSLVAWGNDVLRPKAQEAYNGTIGCPTTLKAGAWCKFCKVREKCKARAEAALGLLSKGDPRLLSPEELPDYLMQADSIDGWCDDIKSYATELLLHGESVPGYKLVEGRSVRRIINPDGLAAVLQKAVPKDMLYKPQELRTITELEKMIGKKAFSDMSDGYIEKPAGKPTLAKITDKRKEYHVIDSDFADAINQLN